MMHGTAYCWETGTVEPSMMVRTGLLNGQCPFAEAAFIGRKSGWLVLSPNAPKKQCKDQVAADASTDVVINQSSAHIIG